MMLPAGIAAHIQGKTGHADTIGMSGSSITVYEDCVLKTETVTPYTQASVDAMVWLAERLPTPQVLHHEIQDGVSYLLMHRIPGKMSCDPEYLDNPSLLVSALAAGMQLLWQTEAAGCPRVRTLEHLLTEAEYRIDHDLVDMDNVDPETFGEGGFESPRHLLDWLRENRIEEEPVLTHGDYCLPNVFLLDGRFSGFVDVADGGIGEKWRDIALCYRSLRDNMNGCYGGKSYPDFDPNVLFEALGIQPDWKKLRYHLLLDELF